MTEPARIFDYPEPADEALREGLRELRALPSTGELRAAFARLERELGDDARQLDADSGVRPAPWAHTADSAAPQGAIEAVPTPPMLATRQRPRISRPRRALLTAATAALSCAATLALWLSHGESERASEPARPVVALTSPQQQDTTPAPAEQTLAPVAQQAATPSAPSSRGLARPTPIHRSERASLEPATLAPGVLNINSIPLSRVVLDGRPLGETPRVQIEVSPGLHTVLFVHPEYGRVFREIRVDSGRAALAAVRFAQGGV